MNYTFPRGRSFGGLLPSLSDPGWGVGGEGEKRERVAVINFQKEKSLSCKRKEHLRG